jgi:ribosomal protein S12 methylthiotransferase accessory factor
MDLTIRFPGGARVDAQMGPHTIHTDKSLKAGGEWTAPTPFETFLASIGTCAGVYVLGFCQQRGLPTDGIQIEQHQDVDPASGMVTGVHLDIHVPPTFPEKYRAALVRSAEQCTVKKHLEHPPEIMTTTIADA